MSCIPTLGQKGVGVHGGIVLYSDDLAVTCQSHSATDTLVPNEISSYYKPLLEAGSIHSTPKR